MMIMNDEVCLESRLIGLAYMAAFFYDIMMMKKMKKFG